MVLDILILAPAKNHSMHLVFVLLSLFAAVWSQQDGSQNIQGQQSTEFICQFLSGDDPCANRPHRNHTNCGSNGVTYDTRCELAEAHCKDNKVNLLHTGPCVKGDFVTTPSHEELVHGSQVVLDVFCIQLSHVPCKAPTHDETICASNNRTYNSYCEYEKGRCTHRHMHVKHTGSCSA